MFNFREELEHIKKARTDYYQYEAEEFLQGFLKKIKEMDIQGLQQIETLDIKISIYSENEVFITGGVNNGVGFTKRYDLQTAKGVFAKIENIIGATYYYAMKKEKDSIHVCL